MDAFSALADPTRRTIIELLAARGKLPASDIYAQFDASPPAISQHLRVLRQANLVRVEKRAQQRLYRLNPETMNELEAWIRETTRRWSARFEQLDEVLEEEKKKMRKEQDDKSAGPIAEL